MYEKEIPVCPECEVAKHVVFVNKIQKIGTAVGGITGALLGFFTGAAVGNKVGEHVYRLMFGEYRCNKCETEFEV